MRQPMIAALALTGFAILPAFAQEPADHQATTIREALDWYCQDWIKPGASDDPRPRHEEGYKAGWREQRSASPAVGPILIKGGQWGQASLVRVNQAAGHRCSISMQLSRTGWTTETAREAVTAWTSKNWPTAYKAKDRAEGPRMSRETIWQADGNLSITLQEATETFAQPNVFITIARADRRGNAI